MVPLTRMSSQKILASALSAKKKQISRPGIQSMERRFDGKKQAIHGPVPPGILKALGNQRKRNIDPGFSRPQMPQHPMLPPGLMQPPQGQSPQFNMGGDIMGPEAFGPPPFQPGPPSGYGAGGEGWQAQVAGGGPDPYSNPPDQMPPPMGGGGQINPAIMALIQQMMKQRGGQSPWEGRMRPGGVQGPMRAMVPRGLSYS
jgi:hypothetical protein